MGRRNGIPGGRWRAIGLALALLAATLPLPAPAQQEQPAPFKHDTRQPIEITADTLEVDREKNIAVFQGNVDAIQGEMRLRARVLTVHYSQKQNAQGTAISRIDAEGDVFVSSPTETAQGQRGVYDVEEGTIRLNDQVVLTRGENVIRGDRLVMDLNSGLSRVESAAAGESSERVHGVFVPGGEKDEEAASGTDKKKNGAADER